MQASLPSKAALRALYRAIRRGLDDDTYRRLSEAIVGRLASMEIVQTAGCIHAFWPLIEHHEIDIRPLLIERHRAGKQIALPVVISNSGSANSEPRMAFQLYEGMDRLRKGSWGLHEPTSGQTVPPESTDLILVPALAADERGHRLGYGKGYYDTFLKDVPAPTICPLFDACVAARIPAEPHDVPVGMIVTETQIILASAAST